MSFVYFCLAFVLITCDFVSKALALKYLKNGVSINLIKNICALSYVENTGAAFGILKNQRIFFLLITILAIAIIGYYFFVSKKNEINKIALIFIFSGTVGNFLDRIFRGYVIDFVELTFIDFPLFNLADTFLIFGLIWLGFDFVFCDKQN